MEKKRSTETDANLDVDENTQFAVLGLGKFGRSLVKTLYDNGLNVLCCDTDERSANSTFRNSCLSSRRL